MYMNTAPRPRPALLYVLRGQRRRAALPPAYGRRGLGGSVTINTPAGPYELPDLPTYTDWVFTKPSLSVGAAPFDAATRRAEMISFLNDWCGLNAGVACAGFDVASVVDAAIQKIQAAISTGIPVSGGATFYPGSNTTCSAGYRYDTAAGRCLPVGVASPAPAPVPPTYTSTPVSRVTPAPAPVLSVETFPPAAAAAPVAGTSVSSALTQNLNVLGVTIPIWGALAAGFGALWLLGGKR